MSSSVRGTPYGGSLSGMSDLVGIPDCDLPLDEALLSGRHAPDGTVATLSEPELPGFYWSDCTTAPPPLIGCASWEGRLPANRSTPQELKGFDDAHCHPGNRSIASIHATAMARRRRACPGPLLQWWGVH